MPEALVTDGVLNAGIHGLCVAPCSLRSRHPGFTAARCDLTATIRPLGGLKSLSRGRLTREDAPIEVQGGRTLEAACLELGLPLDLIALFLVNGVQQPKGYVLRDGDDVRLVALVGGG